MDRIVSRHQRQQARSSTTEWPFDNPEDFKPLNQEQQNLQHQHSNELAVDDLIQGFASFLQTNKDGTPNVHETISSIFDGVSSVIDNLTNEKFLQA